MSKTDKNVPEAEQNGAVLYYPKRDTRPAFPDMPAPRKEEDPLAEMRAAQAKLDQLRAEKAADEIAYEEKRGAIKLTPEERSASTSFLDPFIEILATIEEDKLRTAFDCALTFPTAWNESSHEERLEMIAHREESIRKGWIPMHANSWFDAAINFIADAHAAHMPYQVNLIRRARRELLNGDNRVLAQKSLRGCLSVVDGTHEEHKRYTYRGGAYPLLKWLETALASYTGVENQRTRKFVLARLLQLAPTSCKPRNHQPNKPKAPAPAQG